MTKTELASQVISQFPHLSKKKLGELLNSQYPDQFPTPEIGRDSIRRATKATGRDIAKKGLSTNYIGPNLGQGGGRTLKRTRLSYTKA